MSKAAILEAMPLSKTLRNRLTAMEGDYFMYAKSLHYVEKVIIDDENEKITIKTNLRNYDRKFSSVQEFLSYWEESEAPKETSMTKVNGTMLPQPTIDPEIANLIVTSSNEVNSIIDILKESIDKVKADKEYIKQSNAITSNVNAIINLRKTQLEMLKTSRLLRK